MAENEKKVVLSGENLENEAYESPDIETEGLESKTGGSIVTISPSVNVVTVLNIAVQYSYSTQVNTNTMPVVNVISAPYVTTTVNPSATVNTVCR